MSLIARLQQSVRVACIPRCAAAALLTPRAVRCRRLCVLSTGFHNNNSALYPEVQTPNLDKLANGGIQLDNHYVFKFCSPSRCALQTGRNPIHVNVQNVPPENHNPVRCAGRVVVAKWCVFAAAL